MASVFFLRYVPHARVTAYAALGWVAASSMRSHHGVHSIIMRLAGRGDPQEPAAAALSIAGQVEAWPTPPPRSA